MNERELATVLAALRFWQANRGASGAPGWLASKFGYIETDHGKHERLSDAEIDALCERLNMQKAMDHLLNAYALLRQEALEAPDEALRKALLEDAATVSSAIRDIENGLNRGKHDDEHLAAILRGEV